MKQKLFFRSGVNSALITVILDHIVVKKCSTQEVLHLDIHLQFGGPWGADFDRENPSFHCNPNLTDAAEGKELWKAHGQEAFQSRGREMMCRYAVIWDGQ